MKITKRVKAILATAVVMALMFAAAYHTTVTRVDAQKRAPRGSVPDNFTDSGLFICVGSRVYVAVLRETPELGRRLYARPMIVSLVDHTGRRNLSGWVFPVRGDQVPASWFDPAVPDNVPEPLVTYDPASGPVYVEGLLSRVTGTLPVGVWQPIAPGDCELSDSQTPEPDTPPAE